MSKTLKEIASLISGELNGNPRLVIKNSANLEDAQVGDLTFAFNDKSRDPKLLLQLCLEN